MSGIISPAKAIRSMHRAFWTRFFAITLLGRVALLSLLYFTDTPSGGPIVENWSRFFPHSLVGEAGVIATLTLLLALCTTPLFRRSRRGGALLSSAIGGLYLLAAAADDQVMRWLGQHLSLSYLRTYAGAGADLELVGKIFSGGAVHFLLASGIVFGSTLLFYRLFFQPLHTPALSRRYSNTALLLTTIALAGLTSSHWFAPSKMRWKRIRPISFSIAEELSYNLTHSNKPDDYAEGVTLLGGDPEAKYPFWRENREENSLYTAFAERPMAEKPDIIVLTIETLRGWTTDLRIEGNCERLPHLCQLAQRGLYFPNAQSVGYPSIEGLLGMQVGIWSHPEKTFLSDRASIRMLSLPDILKRAGYHRIVLTATEPSFDNLHPWFARWFDYAEYRPENRDDIPIAHRFEKLYAERDPNKPLYFNWMSTTTHIPFTLPPEFGPDPDDLTERYLRTLSYMDSAVGIVLNAIQKGERAKETIIILTGDHAIPNSGQKQLEEELGAIHEGYTWVPLIITGEGVPSDTIDTTSISHIDIPPTLLQLLQLPVSNHFAGCNLLKPIDRRALFAFRNGEIALKKGSLLLLTELGSEQERLFSPFTEPIKDPQNLVEGFLHGEPLKHSAESTQLGSAARAAAKAWAYLVDRDLLMPPIVSSP